MWMLHPETIAQLELRGRTVRMTAADLNALKECLTGSVPVSALPPEFFRQLFESERVMPRALPSLADPRRWRSRHHRTCRVDR